jgi:chromosome segregation ATPase
MGIRKAWKAISWLTAIKFVALIAAMALLATGHLAVGLVLGVIVAVLLLRDLGSAATNAQAIREEVKGAKEDIGEAKGVLTDQVDRIKQAQEHADATQEDLERARANVSRLQEMNEALKVQAESDQGAFAAVGEQLTAITNQFQAYATSVETSLESIAKEVSDSKEATSELLSHAESAIKGQIDEAEVAIGAQLMEINELIAQQKQALESGIAAYKGSEKPDREKIEDLARIISQAAQLNIKIAKQSTELHTGVKAAIGGIREAVTAQMQKLNQEFIEKHTALTARLVNLSQLAAQKDVISIRIANLRESHDKAWGIWGGGKEAIRQQIIAQEALLAQVQENINSSKSECESLESDLRQSVEGNSHMMEIIASLEGRLNQIDSHAQNVASGFGWGTALGAMGGALGGAGAIAGLPAVAAVLAGAGLGAAIVRGIGALNPLDGLAINFEGLGMP